MYDLSLTETIVAVSTPPGFGGIGIVRLSGPAALEIARSLFRPKTPVRGAVAGRAVFGAVVDPADGRPFDEGFLIAFKAPRSYTGEDVVELSLHGSPVILEEIVRLAVRRGARPALPGEFTLRACLSGRLDLLQAEAVDDLIRSNSLPRAKAAFRGVAGGLSRKIAGLRTEVIDLAARIEADIEFPDERPKTSRKYLINKIDRIKSTVDALLRGYARGLALSRGVTIALVGRANSGKSTLFNGLLEEPRAIVTPFPGTTRDYLRESVAIKDTVFTLIDMAGLGRPGSPVEREGIRRGKKIAAEADAVLLLLDGSRKIKAADRALVESYRTKKIIIVLNKADLPRKTKLADVGRAFPDLPAAGLSALKGDGLPELRTMIHDRFRPVLPEGEIVIFRKREKLLLEDLAARLELLREAADGGWPIETIAEDLRAVVGVIGRLTGEVRDDDVLNKVFSRFCIGK